MDVICTFFRRSERPRTSPRSISVSRSNASCRLCLSGSTVAASSSVPRCYMYVCMWYHICYMYVCMYMVSHFALTYLDSPPSARPHICRMHHIQGYMCCICHASHPARTCCDRAPYHA